MGSHWFAEHGAVAMRCLFWGRICVIPFVLLGTALVWFWCKSIAGEVSACIAALLWCFSPMVLGHGALITPDVSSAVCGTLALYRFRAWLVDGSYWNAYCLGLASALGLLSKFTWFPVLPFTFVVCYAVWRFTLNKPRNFQRDCIQLLFSGSVALVVVNAAYNFSGTGRSLGEIALVSDSLKSSDNQSSKSIQFKQKAARANRFTGTRIGEIPVPFPEAYVQGSTFKSETSTQAQCRTLTCWVPGAITVGTTIIVWRFW